MEAGCEKREAIRVSGIDVARQEKGAHGGTSHYLRPGISHDGEKRRRSDRK